MFRTSTRALRATPSSGHILKAAVIRPRSSTEERHTSLSVPKDVLAADERFPALVGSIPENKEKLKKLAGDEDPFRYEWAEEGGTLVARHRSTDFTRAAESSILLHQAGEQARSLLVLWEEEKRKADAAEAKADEAEAKAARCQEETARSKAEEVVLKTELSTVNGVLAATTRDIAVSNATTLFAESCSRMLASIGEGLLSNPGRRQGESEFRYSQRCLRAARQAKKSDLLKIHDEETRLAYDVLMVLFSGRPSMSEARNAHAHRVAEPTLFQDYLEQPLYYGIYQVCPRFHEVVDQKTAKLLARRWRDLCDEKKL